MKLKVLSLLFLVLFCFVFSCKDKKELPSHLIQLIDDKETELSTGKLVFKEDMQQFFDMHITDSLVFLTSQRNNSPITVLSSKNFERVAELGERSQGPESVDFPLFLKSNSKNGDVELFDLNKRNLIHIGIRGHLDPLDF